MNKVTRTHIANNHIVKMQILDDGLYKLTYPANKNVGLPAKEVQFKIGEEALTITCGKLTRDIELDRIDQLAFMLFYSGTELELRKMSVTLFGVFDTDGNYIEGEPYDAMKLTDDEKCDLYIAAQLIIGKENISTYMKELLHA